MALTADLEVIHRALASQIKTYLDANGRDTNVRPFPAGILSPPCITVHSSPSTYLDYFGTLGPNGIESMFLRIKIEIEAVESESACVLMCKYLGIGTGNGSSVLDAIHSDRSLGGVVGVNGCAALTAEWDSDGDPYTAWIPVQILLTKQNAEV